MSVRAIKGIWATKYLAYLSLSPISSWKWGTVI